MCSNGILPIGSNKLKDDYMPLFYYQDILINCCCKEFGIIYAYNKIFIFGRHSLIYKRETKPLPLPKFTYSAIWGGGGCLLCREQKSSGSSGGSCIENEIVWGGLLLSLSGLASLQTGLSNGMNSNPLFCASWHRT